MARTTESFTSPLPLQGWRVAAAGASVWLVACLAMWHLAERHGLGNVALLAVLAAAVVALWWPLAWSLLGCAVAVLVINYAFVPPRGSLTIDLREHVLLLMTLLAVSWIVSLLMSRQRRLANQEHQHALRVQQLHDLAGLLRDADDPLSVATVLQQALSTLCGGTAVLMMLRDGLPLIDETKDCLWCGQASEEQRSGLWLCARQNRALGPGTGWYDEQKAWYLPLRGRSSNLGAACLPLEGPHGHQLLEIGLRQHAQELCDQMGQALQRSAALRSAASAREEAQAQRLYNTLLAAISHDYRTPLATILGAASALHDQADKLDAQQRLRLAARVVDEAEHLRRLTDNTLQLARLDTPGLTLSADWESVEELVGSVLRRFNQRDRSQRVKARLESGLPLVRCDAVLLVQMLENLVDNALKHGHPVQADAAAVVEIHARLLPGPVLLLAVLDRGPGVPLHARENVFERFSRGGPLLAVGGGEPRNQRSGAGVGLALCRAVARAHGGELTVRQRKRGGSSFECRLPLPHTPEAKEERPMAP